MTTAIDPGCTCGAANFGPGAAHMENCYISLAKDAEAVQGVPVRDLAQEAANPTLQRMGQQPGNPPAPADDLYAPAPVRGRRALTDPGPETEFCKIRFVPGLPTALIESYNTEGKPSIIQAGRIEGKLLNVREVDTNYGVGTAIDLELASTNQELHKLVVGCFASSMLARLVKQVRIGAFIEIVRIPSAERWHVYEVYVLD